MGLELDVGSDDDSWSSQRNSDVIEQVKPHCHLQALE